MMQVQPVDTPKVLIRRRKIRAALAVGPVVRPPGGGPTRSRCRPQAQISPPGTMRTPARRTQRRHRAHEL